MIHPYGMQPTDFEVAEAIKKTNNIYKKLGDAALKDDEQPRNFGIAGPEMFYAEFLSVYANYVTRQPIDDKVEFTIACVRRYLECDGAVRLDFYDKGKGAYEWRPLELRLRPGANFQTTLGVTAELRLIDRSLGMPRDFQDGVTRKGQKVKTGRGVGTLVYHDWHLMVELGVPRLRMLTPLRNKLEDPKKEQFVSSLKKQLQDALNEDENDE